MEDSLELYQIQLDQINAALAIASDDQKPDLWQLQKDLEEIIELTKSSLTDHEAGSSKEAITSSQDGGNLENELNALEGVKCKVPFQYKWGGHGYHDAIILSSEVSDDNSISVKVVFMHPTMKKMQPCPYFLEGTCKYSDEKCHFSHGYLVQLEELRDFSEPDYSTIAEGCTVLAKYKDNLWYKGVVEDVIKEMQFSVKFLHCNDTLLLDFHSVYPIENERESGSDSEDGTIDDAEDNSRFVPHFMGNNTKGTDISKAFGDWEKHTKGIGSRLMAKMGYVPGRGLGREGEGRIEPVQAMVFPPGRSLDRCMELRERAGEGDMLSVEKKLERQKAKAEQRLKQLAHAKKDRSLFDLINSKLSKHPEAKADQGGTSRGQPKMADLKRMSHKNLNVQSLQISEEIKRAERDIMKIKQSLQRQRDRGDLASVSQIRARLAEKEKDLERLKASDQHIAKEQTQRKSSSKLTIF